MKQYHTFSKKFINFLVLFILVISNVVADDDCSNVNKAFDLMGNKLNITLSNCCNNNEVTFCNNQKYITEIKIKNQEVNLTEEVIDHLSKLSNLAILEIRDTKIKVPNNFDKLKNLRTLILEKSFDNTQIPEVIGKMENLETLDLSDNQFKGKIPIFLTNLKNLQKLDLGGNSFEGKIPYEFKELTKLNSFSLNGNEGLTGYIPYFPEIKECDYDKTNLCDLKYSNCKRTQYTYIDQHYCNDYDIKVTNSENGNPDPDYDPNKDVPFTKKIAALYNSYNPISFILLMGIIGFILYTLYYIICKCTNSLRNKIQQKIEKETTPLNNESNESVQNQNNQILKELNDLVLLSTLAYSINEQSEKNKNQENEKSNSMNNNHDDNDNDNNNNNNNNNDNNNNNNNNNNNHAEYNESNGKNNNENNIPTSSIPTLNVPPTSYAPGSYTYQPNTSNPNYVPGPYQPIPPSPNFVPGSYSPIPPSPIPGSQESMPLLQPQPPVPGSQDSMPLIQSPPPPGSFVYQMPSYPPPPPGYYPVLVPVPPTISVEDQSQPPNYSSVSASAPQINTDNKKVDNDKNEKK